MKKWREGSSRQVVSRNNHRWFMGIMGISGSKVVVVANHRMAQVVIPGRPAATSCHGVNFV